MAARDLCCRYRAARRVRPRARRAAVEITPNASCPSASRLPARDRRRRPLRLLRRAAPVARIETIAEAWALLDERRLALRVIGDGPARDVLVAAGAEMLGRYARAVPRLLGEGHRTGALLARRAGVLLAAQALRVPGCRPRRRRRRHPACADVTEQRGGGADPAGDAPALARAVSMLRATTPRVRVSRRAQGAGGGAHLQRRGQRIVEAGPETSREPAARDPAAPQAGGRRAVDAHRPEALRGPAVAALADRFDRDARARGADVASPLSSAYLIASRGSRSEQGQGAEPPTTSRARLPTDRLRRPCGARDRRGQRRSRPTSGPAARACRRAHHPRS